MKKLRKGDPVIVIAGKHKGAISSIAQTSGDFVYLKDVNVVKRATKGQGFVKKTLPLHHSNVAYYLADQKTATKIWVKINSKWKRIRFAKKTGKDID